MKSLSCIKVLRTKMTIDILTSLQRKKDTITKLTRSLMKYSEIS